jgi:hypothetical protein
MSIVVNCVPFVEITLLNSILATSISAVRVATSPGWLILSPPTVNHIWLGSAFLGLTKHVNCPYVMSFLQSAGTLCWEMNLIVLVGILMRPQMPFANPPNLLAADRLHAFFVFWAVHWLPVIEELAHVLVHDCYCLMDFVFQPCDAVCESHESALMSLLFHDCCIVAWLTCWCWQAQLLRA